MLKSFAILLSAFGVGQASPVSSNVVSYERLDVNNTVLLIVDEQIGLFNLARDWDPRLFHSHVMAHAAIGKLFDIPVILTTSAQAGPNGPLFPEILEMYPNAPLIERPGEIDAWDNANFRNAVAATGRKQIVLAGIVTDVCTTDLALSLRADGYSVWANVEASATTSTLLRDVSNSRMQAAGVQLVGIFSIMADLFRDWRNEKPTAEQVIAWMNRYTPEYSMSARQFNAAKIGKV